MLIKKKSTTAYSQKAVNETAAKLKLPRAFTELLFSRGFDTAEKIDVFLNPSKTEFHDPFLLKGMREAAERINAAFNDGEKILVYSDYDADGICASAILSLFFASRGVEVYTHIPNRNEDGYGLNIETLEGILEEVNPDLIVTCDCGISCHEQVDYVLDLGVDIIVTDHHSVGDTVPSCVVVNAHQTDCGYPFKELCGAGVALKLVQAIAGFEAAEEYLDMAAVATVADLVSLTGENRLIVHKGLEQLNKRTNLGLSRLLDSLDIGKPTSTDIAFKVSPRINAAGRMGDASRAFDLLCLKDITKINALIAEIERDNDSRKQLCDRVYDEAIELLAAERLWEKRAIVLSSEGWEKGITGIVTARLSGEFQRPAVILARAGDCYKGTVRSIEGINVYDALYELRALLDEFGGHSQAAGFSIKPENVPLFKAGFQKAVAGQSIEPFLPSYYYDISLDEKDLTKDFVKCLELLEPFGHANHRPVFRIRTDVIRVDPCKSNSCHNQITTPSGLVIYAFNSDNKLPLLCGAGPKELLVELQCNSFGQNPYSGVLRHAETVEFCADKELAEANYIKLLNFKSSSDSVKTISYDALDTITDDSTYGTLFIAGKLASADKAADKVILRDFLKSSGKNNLNRLIVSPDFDSQLMLPLYNKVIFLDSPPSDGVISYIARRTDAQIYVPESDNFAEFLQGVDLSREIFGAYYDIMRKNSEPARDIQRYFNALNRDGRLSLRQFVVCLTVFTDLGLVSVSGKREFCVRFNKDVRAPLTSSKIYNYLCEKKQ